MKKTYPLLGLLFVFLSTGKIYAADRVYSLHDLTATEFAAGGGQYWSFDKYDIATGVYSSLATYGDDGKVNYYDKFNPERYASYPIMMNPGDNQPYVPARNSWYSDKNEYIYVARDYEVGIICVEDLVYGTVAGKKNIPEEIMGYEVYSSPAEGGGMKRNSAITFNVTQDGYYRVDMSVIREDHIFITGMTVIPRYRYEGREKVSDISRIECGVFGYGEGDGSSFETSVDPPEYPIQGDIYGNSTLRCMPQEVYSHYFYVYAKAGDKISFEVDARDMPTVKDPRDVWARTKWTNLKLTEVDKSTAEAAGDKYCDPYKEDAEAVAQVSTLLTEAKQLLDRDFGTTYAATAKENLSAAYNTINEAYETTMMPMEAPGFIKELETTIAVYRASRLGVVARYTFDKVNGSTVTDNSAYEHKGKLEGVAKVVKMGKYNVLSLGNGGYFDMGATVGMPVYTMDDFTIAAYYRVDKDASLSGEGYFLWNSSTQSVISANEGQFFNYQLNKQSYMIAEDGHNSASTLSRENTSDKDVWKHVVVRQKGDITELWIDGILAKTTLNGEAISSPTEIFRHIPEYNWIGRPPFHSDNYLSNTLVYDFCMYNQAVEDEQIADWAAALEDLEYEYKYGEKGSFTSLTTLISKCNELLAKAVVGTGVGQYPADAIYDMEDAVLLAQTFVNADRGSQFLIDAEYDKLKDAYDLFMSSAGYAMVYPAASGQTAYPFESGLYYVQVGDLLLTMPESGGNLQLGRYIDNPDKENNNQVWNIQFNETKSVLTGNSPYALFSFVSDRTVWEGDGSYHMDRTGEVNTGNTEIAQAETNENWSWRGYMIYFNGTYYAIENHYEKNAVTFTKETRNETATASDTKKFQYLFRTIDSVVANPPNSIATESVNGAAKAMIYGVRGAFIIEEADLGSKIAVYDISGRLVKSATVTDIHTEVSMNPGLYIIQVGNQVGKVIVQ